MKTTEKILGIIIVLSLVLKIFNIPGNSVLFVFSVSFLVMIYFYLGFALFNEIPLKGIFKKKSYENIHGLRIIGAVFSGMSLSMILAGILFKIQHWPGENTQLASGLVLSAIIILVALSKYIKRKGPFYRRMLTRFFIIGAFGTVLLFTPKYAIDKFRMRNHPEYIKALEAFEKDPGNGALLKKLQEEEAKAFFTEEELEYRKQQQE